MMYVYSWWLFFLGVSSVGVGVGDIGKNLDFGFSFGFGLIYFVILDTF